MENVTKTITLSIDEYNRLIKAQIFSTIITDIQYLTAADIRELAKKLKLTAGGGNE